jgi:hypothetical protein
MKVFSDESVVRIVNGEGLTLQIKDCGSVSVISALKSSGETWGKYQAMKKGLISAIFKEMDFVSNPNEQYAVLFKGLYQPLVDSKPLSEVNYVWADQAVAKGYVGAARVLLAVPRFYLFSFDEKDMETWKQIIKSLE